VLPHAPSEPPWRLGHLDGIARGILQEDLIAPDPSNQIAPEANTGGTLRRRPSSPGAGTHLDGEVELPGVDRDRRVESGDDITDGDLAHASGRLD
jgi:hypothetical protein